MVMVTELRRSIDHKIINVQLDFGQSEEHMRLNPQGTHPIPIMDCESNMQGGICYPIIAT